MPLSLLPSRTSLSSWSSGAVLAGEAYQMPEGACGGIRVKLYLAAGLLEPVTGCGEADTVALMQRRVYDVGGTSGERGQRGPVDAGGQMGKGGGGKGKGDGCGKAGGKAPVAPALDLLNGYCEQKKIRPTFDWSETVIWHDREKGRQEPGWLCILYLPGIGEARGEGSSKKAAKSAAAKDCVDRMQAMGIRLTKSSDLKAGSAGPAWAIAGSASLLMGGGVGGARLPSGNVTGVLQGMPIEEAYDFQPQASRMIALLRRGQADEALAVAQAVQIPKVMKMKHLADCLTSIGVRTKDAAAQRFMRGILECGVVNFPNAASASYFCRFGTWAMREFIAEAVSCAEQARSVVPQTLERNGTCIREMTISGPDKGMAPNELKLVPSSGELPRGSSFFKGDWILVTTPHTNQVRVDEENGRSASYEAEAQQVDRAANHVTYVRQITALHKLTNDPGGLDWLSLVLMAAEEEDGFHKVADLCACPPPTGRCPPVASVLAKANESQCKALEAALSRRLTLVQGPPGAGKTSTAVLLMQLWTFAGRKPILATADSNIAVDNLCGGCVTAGLNVVRVGRKESGNPDLEQYTLFEKARASGKPGGDRNKWKAEKEILENADVVCCTCSGAEHPAMQGTMYANLLLDEAGQTTELGCMIPMLHLNDRGSVVLVGDHKQLPATVACLEADVEGLGTSLFERLTSFGVVPQLLDILTVPHAPCHRGLPFAAVLPGQAAVGHPRLGSPGGDGHLLASDGVPRGVPAGHWPRA
ncbi:unnamed protein product [Prorocentrum cordatum]|uniref:DRBM domain-containing protein n=1 Tax=Prorocentrum cordatum TaxID=2364126 RepID=A0ABN9R5F9_9DINO|nr:unnamed protein product [Polarella glacialis]